MKRPTKKKKKRNWLKVGIVVSIEDATRAIFATGGPFHQVMKQHRVDQETAAIDYAAQLDASILTTDIKPLIRQIATGVGKSHSYMVPLIVAHHLHGRRALISTFTKELRDDLKLFAQQSAQAVSLYFGQQINPSIVVRESITTRASLQWAALILKDHPNDPLAMQYFDWVVDCLEAGDLPELNGSSTSWLAKNSDLPGNLEDYSVTLAEQGTGMANPVFISSIQSQLDAYCIRHKKLPLKAEEIMQKPMAQFSSANSRYGDVGKADILIVTHAMFLMNNAHYGDVLHTSKKETDEQEEVRTDPFNLVLDEAEMLHRQAANWTKFQISDREIATAIDKMRPYSKKEMTSADNSLNDLIKVAQQYHRTPRRSALRVAVKSPKEIEIIENDVDRHNISDQLYELYKFLLAGYKLSATKVDTTSLQYIEKICGNIDRIFEIIEFPTTSSTQAAINKGTKTKLLTHLKDDTLTVSTEPLHNNYLASWAWRNAVQNVGHVYALSATLVGGDVQAVAPKDAYKPFMDRVGIRPNEALCLAPIPAWRHGGLSRMVFAAPSLPRDKSASIYAEHVVKCLIIADRTPILATNGASRTLVLFHSSEMLKETEKLLKVRAPHIAAKICQGKLNNKNLAAFAASTDSIWFGHNWQGANFTTKNGVTLIGRIIITKAPVTPPSTVKATYTFRRMHSDNADDAAMKFIQGTGRGIRQPSDRPEMWSLDPYVYEANVYKRFAGRGGGGNAMWKSMLDGLPKHWVRQCKIIEAIDPNYQLVRI